MSELSGEQILDQLQTAIDATDDDAVAESLRELLYRIAPARKLPPEPPVGAVMEALLPDGQVEHWVRNPHGWVLTGRPVTATPIRAWANVCTRPNVRRVVPDPAAVVVKLPWACVAGEADHVLHVERSPHAGDVLVINGVHLSQNIIAELASICAIMLRPGAERDALFARPAKAPARGIRPLDIR